MFVKIIINFSLRKVLYVIFPQFDVCLLFNLYRTIFAVESLIENVFLVANKACYLK